MTNALQLLAFIHTTGKLKQVLRRGWQRYGIEDVESVADHSWRLAVIALVIGSNRDDGKELDTAKMVSMALLHDLAETSTGDITPSDGISKEDKDRLEERAIKRILIDIDKSGELFNIWKEYVHCGSEEAKLMNALDKLEMACQAKEYQARSGADLSEFIKMDEELQDDLIREIYDILQTDTTLKT